MSVIRSLLSRTKQILLIYGYVRELNEDYVLTDLMKVCIRFYDDASEININKKDYKKFLSSECGEIIAQKSFTIQGIEFNAIIQPNGRNKSSSGYVQYYIQIDSVPEYVKNVRISFILSCKQTNYEFRSMHQFTRYHKRHGWRPDKLLLQQCEDADYDRMDFGVYIDLLCIEYHIDKYPELKTYKNEAVLMNKSSAYKWYMGEQTLDKLRSLKFGDCIYSNNFEDNCWCLVATPQGLSEYKKGVFRLSIKLLRLPYDISRIRIRYTVISDYINDDGDEIDIEKEYIFGWHNIFEVLYLDKLDLEGLDSLTMRIGVEILGIWGRGRGAYATELKNESEWVDYGIVLE